jgi:hypothetical protein
MNKYPEPHESSGWDVTTQCAANRKSVTIFAIGSPKLDGARTPEAALSRCCQRGNKQVIIIPLSRNMFVILLSLFADL